MISVDQWRCAIGSFQQPRSGKSSDINSSTKADDYDMCARLLVVSSVLWSLYLMHTAIDVLRSKVINTDISHFECVINASVYIATYTTPTYQQPAVNTLILCNDIESNPGPMSAELEEAVKMLTDHINVKFDVMQHQLSHLTQTADNLKTELSSLKEKVSSVSAEQTESKNKIIELHQRVDKLEEDRERAEQYSRRENVIFHGVPEQPNESFSSTRSMITQLLNTHVTSKKWNESDILRTHRLTSQSLQSTKKPRPISVRFHQFHDKLAVLKARPQIKSIGVGVSGDLTQKQRDRLRQLPDDVKGYFKGGRLHTEKRTSPRHFSSTQSQPPSSIRT